MSEKITIAQAIKKFGVTRTEIRQWIASDELQSETKGGKYFLDETKLAVLAGVNQDSKETTSTPTEEQIERVTAKYRQSEGKDGKEERILVSAAAKKIGLSREAVYGWARDGEISTVSHGRRGSLMVLLSECKRQYNSSTVRFSLSNKTWEQIKQVAHDEGISNRAATELLIGTAWAQWYKEKNDESV